MADKNSAVHHKITLAFIINGQEIRIETSVEAPLESSVRKALHDTGNSGRRFEEWEVRDAAGALLDISRKVIDLHLSDGARLFVSLRVGAGGRDARRS